MTSVAIVYYSGYGHTQKVAEAVAAGAGSLADVTTRLLLIDANGELPADGFATLDAADAIIYGSPTYMGGPAWQFKKFADATSKNWYVRAWQDKVGAGFTNSASLNGDKAATLTYLWTLAQQHGQIWVGLGLLPSNKKESGPADVNWAGASGGLLTISPSDASPDEAPRTGDLETARLFGKRVAEVTKKLRG